MPERTCVSLLKSLPGQFDPKAWLADPTPLESLGVLIKISLSELWWGWGEGAKSSLCRSRETMGNV